MLDDEERHASRTSTDAIGVSTLRPRPCSLDAEQRARVAAMVTKLTPKARRLFHQWRNVPVEDLLQIAALVITERALDHDPRRSSFFTYVFRRAVGAMVDACKHTRRECLREALGEEDCDGGSFASRVEDRERVEALLAVLDAEERTLVVMRVVEGRSLADVAREMGIGIGQAEYREKGATEKMQKVGRRCPVPPKRLPGAPLLRSGRPGHSTSPR